MNDQVYVVVWQDKHSDTGVYVYSTADAAVEWARSKAREYDRFGDLDEELTGGMTEAGWLYYGRYSCEGDHLRVIPCRVDPSDLPEVSVR